MDGASGCLSGAVIDGAEFVLVLVPRLYLLFITPVVRVRAVFFVRESALCPALTYINHVDHTPCMFYINDGCIQRGIPDG